MTPTRLLLLANALVWIPVLIRLGMLEVDTVCARTEWRGLTYQCQ